VLALGGELDDLAFGPLADGDPARDGGPPPFELRRCRDGVPEFTPRGSVQEGMPGLRQAEFPERGVGADALGDLGDAVAGGVKLGIRLGPPGVGTSRVASSGSTP
jgi:hypothetical protein